MSDYDQLFCIKLAKAVKKHPCLYNYNLPNYSSKAALDAAWDVVAKEVGTTVPKCKDKWRNIRTVFSRNLRRGRAGDLKKRPYYLKGLLQFLIPFVKTSRSGASRISNVPALEMNETESNNDLIEIKSEKLDEDRTSVDVQPPVATESYSPFQFIQAATIMATDASSEVLSKNNASEYHYIPNNEVEEKICSTRKMFLLSLLPDVTAMTESQFRKFRMMALSSVDRILACSNETSAHESRLSDFNIGMDVHNQVARQIKEPSSDKSEEIVKTEPTVQESPLPVPESVVSIDASRVDRINKNDACSYFGKYIAEELRPLPIQRRMLVQKEIHESISAALIDTNSQIDKNDQSVM